MFTTAENYLQRTSPESQGIASTAILRFVEAVESQIHELHSFMLLRHGNVVAGPAIVEEEKTTVVVPPGAELAVDAYANYLITIS